MQKIKIRVGISFVLLVALFICTHQFLMFLNYIIALTFHEMAHLYVARAKGYNSGSIKFDILGASIKLDNRIQKDDLFAIAFAGPAVNFLICIICTSLWWIVPESYVFTADFFRINLLLASFNLIPVIPLDGSKILDSILSKRNERLSLILNWTISIIVVGIYLILFIASCFNAVNFSYLIFCIFFITNLLPKRRVNFDVYYKLFFKKNKKVEKINFLHVQPSCSLIEMIKHTKEGYFTIFYCELGEPIYITEQELQILITKHALTTTIKQAIKK